MNDQSLKKTLMEMGNELVTDYGFTPSFGQHVDLAEAFLGSTIPIAIFTEWLNQNPDAREVLEKHGFKWEMPVVK